MKLGMNIMPLAATLYLCFLTSCLKYWYTKATPAPFNTMCKLSGKFSTLVEGLRRGVGYRTWRPQEIYI